MRNASTYVPQSCADASPKDAKSKRIVPSRFSGVCECTAPAHWQCGTASALALALKAGEQLVKRQTLTASKFIKFITRPYAHRDFPRIPVKGGVLGGAAPGFLVAALPVGVRALPPFGWPPGIPVRGGSGGRSDPGERRAWSWQCRTGHWQCPGSAALGTGSGALRRQCAVSRRDCGLPRPAATYGSAATAPLPPTATGTACGTAWHWPQCRTAALPVALSGSGTEAPPTGTGMLCSWHWHAAHASASASGRCAPTGRPRPGPGQPGQGRGPVGPTPLPEAAGAAGGGQPASHQLSQRRPRCQGALSRQGPPTPGLLRRPSGPAVALCDCRTAALPHC